VPTPEWGPIHSQGIAAIQAANYEAGFRAHTARDCVDSLYYLYDLDAAAQPNGFEDVLGHRWSTVDLSHARGASTTAITAIDLCAAALGRIHSGIEGDAWDRSVVSALKDAKITAIPGAAEWLEEVAARPLYEIIRDARHLFTHQAHKHHAYMMVSEAEHPLGKRMILPLKIGDIEALLSVREFIERARDLAHQEVASFLISAAAGDMTPGQDNSGPSQQ
jgi:hypothetical protein